MGKFFRLGSDDKLLFAEAMVFMIVAKLMVTVMPVGVCISTIRGCGKRNVCEVGKTRLIKNAIRRASRLFFRENSCLVKSLAARWMLQRRNIRSVFSIGVMYDEAKSLKAHAWITAEGEEIVPRGGEFKTLTAY